LIGNSQHGFGAFRPPAAGAGAAMLRADHGTASGLAQSGLSDIARQPQANYAALDLGTNNCRVLIARPARGGFRVVDAFSRIVRLGEGLSASGELSETAMARTIEALKVCAGKIGQRKVMAGRYVATEACRRAVNCTEFLDRVRDEIGIELEIISTAEEARLVVAGCAPLLHSRIPYAVVFDIGGGSTEIVWLRRHGSGPAYRAVPEILGSVSLPFGVVTFTERFGGIEVSPTIYRAMVAEAEAALLPFEREHGIRREVRARQVQMLGSSGTVTTLAAIHLELPRYNRIAVDGSSLSFAEVEAVSRGLLSMDYAERVAHPCIGAERADLVLAGCAILEAICTLWPVGRVRVADRGLREGILQGLLAGC
jgi:exopolyphosphatase / guanosine-5'-triphosphate,3'-diphosphate pyrophosphatase